MKRKHTANHCASLDIESLRLDLQSPDDAVRARAVRALCPCHAGWQPFEEHIQLLAELQKDASHLVRSVAKHVFEDAAEMESSGYPTNPREISNDMLRTKRALRFPRDAEEITRDARTRQRARGRNGGKA